MRLVTYGSSRGPRAGCLLEGAAIGAWELLGEPQRSSLRELLAEGRLADLRAAIAVPVPVGH